LKDLDGPHVLAVQVQTAAPSAPAAPGSVVEYPATFNLRNGSWGNVRVESLRVPISTVVETTPELPATIKPGGTLQVKVISKIRPGVPMAKRVISLETKGQEPLQLVVQPEAAK
jgi:hypothetical protein